MRPSTQRSSTTPAQERFSLGRSQPRDAEPANCDIFFFATSCAETRRLLDSLARRARNASRTKPSSRAVGGSRRSTRTVDESEIDSANETAALGSPFRFGPPSATRNRVKTASQAMPQQGRRFVVQTAAAAKPPRPLRGIASDASERVRALPLFFLTSIHYGLSVLDGPQRLGLPGRIRACLFDLDGVLTQTARVHAAAWKEMFDAFLRERAAKTGEPFVPFDPVADYNQYVDGKPRYDGVRSFLASRGIRLPEGHPSDPPSAETVYG